MRSRLQLDVRKLNVERRHLVNVYEVKAGIGVIAGKTVWSMPERLRGFTTMRYINPLYRTLPYDMGGGCLSGGGWPPPTVCFPQLSFRRPRWYLGHPIQNGSLVSRRIDAQEPRPVFTYANELWCLPCSMLAWLHVMRATEVSNFLFIFIHGKVVVATE